VILRGYKAIRTLTFIPRAETVALERIWTCVLPTEVRQQLRGLKARRAPDGGKSTLPVRSLNAAMAALVPGLISIAPGVGHSDFDGPWLRAGVKPGAEVVPSVMASWVRAEFEGDDAAKFAAGLMKCDFAWEPAAIDVTAWQASGNGTAEPAPTNDFPFLAHFLAAELAKPEVKQSYGGSIRSWRRAPAAVGSPRVADLISWPAFEMTRGERRWLFSIGLRLRVETLPWVMRPYVFAELSLRRWMTQAVKSGDRRAVTVLLSPRVPWHGRAHSQREFQQARLERRWDRGKKLFEWRWADGLTDVLNDFGQAWNEPVPNPQRLTEDPGAWLPGKTNPAALIVYREGMRPGHPVGPGWGPIERSAIFREVVTALQPWVELSDPPSRITSLRQRSMSESNLASAAWSVVEGASGRIELLLLNQSVEISHAVRTAGTELLGISPEPGARSGWVWRRGENEVAVNVVPLGSLGGSLELAGRKRSDYYDAVSNRVSDVKAALAGGEGIRGSLIELGHHDEFRAWSSDPKFAIRRGAALSGYLTQFLTPIDDTGSASTERRARSALLDLFRQWGLVSSAPGNLEWQVIAFWMIKQTGPTSLDRRAIEVPVSVRLTGSGAPQLRAPAFSGWLPYREGLLRLVHEVDPFASRSISAAACQSHFSDWLQDALDEGAPTLLLTSAQNIRRHWPAMNNKNIAVDSVPCGSRTWQSGNSLLRHVRVRTSEFGETPEWYGEPGGGHPAGIWTVPGTDRVFYSAHRRAVTAKYNLRLSKVTQWATAEGALRQPRPTARPQNPQLVEMAVALTQSGDEPVDLARRVHALRVSAAHYSDPLVLPLPLHLANLAREYVLADSYVEDSSSGA
jgi:hypothetical protein